MNERYNPELMFLKQKLPGIFLKEDKRLLIAIFRDILLQKKRSWAADLVKLAEPIEKPGVEGVENIPIADNAPVVIVGNHPVILDLMLGALFISHTFARVRGHYNLPVDIHWMIAENTPPKDVPCQGVQKIFVDGYDWLRQKFIETYNFIPVPVGENNLLARRRAKSLKRAITCLQGENGSNVIGIFPEGENGDQTAYYQGIGHLILRTNDPKLHVLPTVIFRDDEGKLNINFGETVSASYFQGMCPMEATETIKKIILRMAPLQKEVLFLE